MENSSTAEPIEVNLKLEEAKRRKREGLVILATTLMVLAFAFFEVQLPETAPEYSLGNNIAFFLLINVNVILLALLVFLVVRNLVKLVFERSEGFLGSACGCGCIGICCVIARAYVACSSLRADSFPFFERWFDLQVENALQALEIGQTYYQNSANNALFSRAAESTHDSRGAL
jgi:two-component system nitrogen regulation sensor histidine kinase NtrY